MTMLARTIVGVVLCFTAGTVSHELTHWAAARLLGAEVHSIRYVPPPEVLYEPATATADQWVKVAPVLATVPVLLGISLAGRNRSIPVMFALAAFGLGYLPRSPSDWAPVADYLKCTA